jgi:GNAT superfamily N-acetyltransferase
MRSEDKMNFVDFYLKEHSDYEYVYDEEIDSDDADIAYKIAKKHGISVLSDKDLFCIVKDGEEVIGGLWHVFMSGEYSFDVVVRDDYQGKGIGKKLVDIAIREYNETKEAYGDDTIIRADVVNQDVMIPLLLKKGFEIESKSPGHTLMTRK